MSSILENNLVIFLRAVTSQCSKNPEDLCCRNGMGKFAALILGCGTIFGIFLLAYGLFWFKMPTQKIKPIFIRFQVGV